VISDRVIERERRDGSEETSSSVMQKTPIILSILTEKNWFHYAARIWDGVKKSSALAEYSRLLA